MAVCNKMCRDVPANPSLTKPKQTHVYAFKTGAAAAKNGAYVARLPLLYGVVCARKHQVVHAPGGHAYKGGYGKWPEPNLYH